jgi:restriction endonuclease S subunit
MQKRIKDIAIVRSGAYIKEAPEGSVHYLQVGNYSRAEGGFLFSVPTLELNEKTKGHLLLDGDIVFAAKGTSNFCVVYRKKMGEVVASSSFLVIRIIDKKNVSPDYLCWILNREDTLALFKANAIGTSMPSIGKPLIEEHVVNMPPKEIQDKIVTIAQLQQRERDIYENILNLKSKVIQTKLIEMTK